MAPPLPNKKRWTSAANLDMYRKVPTDLMEGSIQGSLLSWVTLIVIVALFYLETNSFWYESHLTTLLTLDGKRHAKDKIRVAFNITMMDLKCDYVNVNVVSVLGGRETKQKAEEGFVNKYMVSEGDVKRRFQDRNAKQDDLPEFHRHRLLEDHQLHDKSVTQSLEELHKNGRDAIPLDGESLELALEQYPFVFVDYFVGWCSHCRLFAPTWERFAEIIGKAAKEESEESPLVDMEDIKHENYTEEEMKDAIEAVENNPPIFVGTVDCVLHPDLCRHEGIHSYPTIRLYVEGEQYEPDFKGHRTLHNLLQFLLLAEEDLLKTENNGGEGNERLLLTEHIDQVNTWQSIHDHYTASNDDEVTNKESGISDEKLAQVEQEERLRIEEHRKNNPDDFPGCEVVGMFLLDKVPGHFYIQAQSASDTLEPTMTNVSHEIHRLEFNHSNWETHNHAKVKENREALPEDWQTIFKPMDGNVYVHHHLHQAHHHYLKLVPTNQPEYQVLQNSQLAHYTPQAVPEAKFIYDISPISVQYQKQPVKRWYDYVTSVMAIIGGTFTVAGIIQNSLRFVTEKTIQIATRRRQRRNRGNSAQQQQQFQLARPPPPGGSLKTPSPVGSNTSTSTSAVPSMPAQSYSSPSYGAPANRPYMTPSKGGRTPLPRPPPAR